MLQQIEGLGLNQRGIPPQFKGAVASIGANRPCIVSRATYANYSIAAASFTANAAPVILSYTFPGNTLVPGTQIRYVLGGLYGNQSGGVQNLGARAKITGANGSFQMLGGRATIASLAGFVRAWRVEMVLAVSIPAADGQYVPNLRTSANTANSTYTSNLAPNNAIAFTDLSSTHVTDGVFALVQDVGGVLLNATPNGTVLSSNIFQQVFDATQNIRVDVILDSVTQISVSCGYMEAL